METPCGINSRLQSEAPFHPGGWPNAGSGWMVANSSVAFPSTPAAVRPPDENDCEAVDAD